jgi:hypothetical protein
MTRRPPKDFIPQPPRMTITWEVLKAAKRVGDEPTIAACRRIIVANRRGWRMHGDAADLRQVYAFNAILHRHGINALEAALGYHAQAFGPRGNLVTVTVPK